MNYDELFTKEQHEQGAEMQVADEHGKLLDMSFIIVGVDSKLWRKSFNEFKKNTINEVEDAEAELYASVTIGWKGVLSEGKELKFTKELMKSFLVNAPYLIKQCDLFVGNRENFTKS